jgi:hypothetical protein
MSLLFLRPKTKKKYFQCTVKTDNLSTGSTNNNQFKLPLESGGTYGFFIDWGDNKRDYISAYNQVETTHTYDNIGTYLIKIWGKLIGFRFNNTGDRLKILTIPSWGNLELGNSNGYFYGCANLDVSATDVLKNPTMTTATNFFRNCSSLTKSININTSNINSYNSMYKSCSMFNDSISNLDSKNVTDFESFFDGDTLFNKPVNNLNTAKVYNMFAVFYANVNFNQDISSWNLSLVATMASILTGANAWSRANYDLFLIGAHAQALSTGVQSNVPFRCVPGYTLGGAAQAAHDYLSGTKGWLFTDGGGV